MSPTEEQGRIVTTADVTRQVAAAFETPID
jgi:hypothetical protein